MEDNLDRNLDRNLDKNLDRNLDKNLDRNLDKNIDKSLDKNLDKNLFMDQVGGHHLFLRHETQPDWIVKPARPREIKFYKEAQKHPALLPALCPFHGTIARQPHSPADSVVLTDLTYGMELSCLLDVKIGRRLHDIDASLEKIARTTAKAARTTSKELGFRISGMKTVDVATMAPVYLYKAKAKELAAADLSRVFRSFFIPAGKLKHALVAKFISRLTDIRGIVEREGVLMYSSSVLLVYDAARPETRWECCLIDFAHSHLFVTKEVTDQNYLDGLDSLIEYIGRSDGSV